MATDNRYLDANGEFLEPQRLDWFDGIVVLTSVTRKGLWFAHNVADQLDNLARSHANYRRDRAEQWGDQVEEIRGLPETTEWYYE